MARLIALTDRLPGDTDWKGAVIWRLILGLAESQHDVLAITPHPPEQIEIMHSHLQIVRPVKSWNATQLPGLAQAILSYRPDGIHTFPLKPSHQWPKFTVWPWLASALPMIPHLKCWASLFELSEWDQRVPWREWFERGRGVTVFHEADRLRLRETFTGAIQVCPLELDLSTFDGDVQDKNRGLIPAPVSEWHDREGSLKELAQHLSNFPETQVTVLGGWGTLNSDERRNGWQALEGVGTRVHMHESVSLDGFINLAQTCEFLWLKPLDPASWRYQISAHAAERLGKTIHESPYRHERFQSGSAANFYSRLYSGT